MRPLSARGIRLYAAFLAALGVHWPRGLSARHATRARRRTMVRTEYRGADRGMIFANSMNTVSLTAERFEAELGHGTPPTAARRAALDAALIPQINTLFAVGPGRAARHDDRPDSRRRRPPRGPRDTRSS